MATLESLLNDVKDLTKRPDLESQIKAALQKALTFAHLSSFYFHDATEVKYNVEEDGQFLSFELPDRFRKEKYVRTQQADLTFLSSADLFNPHITVSKSNIFYVAGTSLVIRTDHKVSAVYLGYYRMPSFADSFIVNDDNWSQMLVDRAAARVFSTIGNSKKANEHELLFRQQLELLLQSGFDI